MSQFPLCLLEKKSYSGIKGLVGLFFWVGFIYFCYGINNFLMWGNTFFKVVFELFTKPIYLLYHISVFSLVYSFTWAIFDFDGFRSSIKKLVMIVLAILYVCSPVDFIPDVLPIIGQFDDAIVGIIGVYNLLTLGEIPKKKIEQ